jgi:hypothetical protein
MCPQKARPDDCWHRGCRASTQLALYRGTRTATSTIVDSLERVVRVRRRRVPTIVATGAAQARTSVQRARERESERDNCATVQSCPLYRVAPCTPPVQLSYHCTEGASRRPKSPDVAVGADGRAEPTTRLSSGETVYEFIVYMNSYTCIYEFIIFNYAFIYI